MDCSPPASSAHEIFTQARILAWRSHSLLQGDLPHPGIEPGSPNLHNIARQLYINMKEVKKQVKPCQVTLLETLPAFFLFPRGPPPSLPLCSWLALLHPPSPLSPLPSPRLVPFQGEEGDTLHSSPQEGVLPALISA